MMIKRIDLDVPFGKEVTTIGLDWLKSMSMSTISTMSTLIYQVGRRRQELLDWLKLLRES